MRTVRLLHTGDVHLGARFSFLGEKGREHRRQLLATFSRVAELARTNQVDFLLICGDLFDSDQPPRETLESVLRELDELGRHGIQTLLVPGTHDRLSGGGVYEDEAWSRNPHLHVFREKGWSKAVFPASRTVFYGWGYHGRHDGDVLAELRLDEEAGDMRHVALLHASMLSPGLVEGDEVTFSRSSLEASGLDYLALGHWHSFKDLSTQGVGCAYCGSPEALYVGQESGKVVLVTLSDSGREIKPVGLGKRSFSRLEVDLQTVSDPGRLREIIRGRADQHSRERDYLEVLLKGICLWDLPPDPLELEEEMANLFYGIRVRDESVMAESPRSQQSGGLVSREFARIAREAAEKAEGEEKRLCDEALRLGLAYLEGRRS
jgi:exonuclease SbcD